MSITDKLKNDETEPSPTNLSAAIRELNPNLPENLMHSVGPFWQVMSNKTQILATQLEKGELDKEFAGVVGDFLAQAHIVRHTTSTIIDPQRLVANSKTFFIELTKVLSERDVDFEQLLQYLWKGLKSAPRRMDISKLEPSQCYTLMLREMLASVIANLEAANSIDWMRSSVLIANRLSNKPELLAELFLRGLFYLTPTTTES